MSPSPERSNNTTNTWIAGCLGAAGVIVAAIIALGAPIAQRAADFYFPTLTSVPNNPPGNAFIPVTTPTQSAVLPQSPLLSEPSPQNDCSKLIEGEHHDPVLSVEWKIDSISENRIIHVWSNHWENNLPEYKFFLPAGQSVSFMSGGGSFWTEKPGCNGMAQVIYDTDSLKEITIVGYQNYIQQKTVP